MSLKVEIILQETSDDQFHPLDLGWIKFTELVSSKSNSAPPAGKFYMAFIEISTLFGVIEGEHLEADITELQLPSGEKISIDRQSGKVTFGFGDVEIEVSVKDSLNAILREINHWIGYFSHTQESSNSVVMDLRHTANLATVLRT